MYKIIYVPDIVARSILRQFGRYTIDGTLKIYSEEDMDIARNIVRSVLHEAGYAKVCFPEQDGLEKMK